MCYVKTTAEPLIGEPKVYIETNSGYSSIVAKFTPNNDTYYFYQFCSLTEEIEEFIGSYGNDIYTDLIRTWYAEATNAKEDDTDFTMSWTFNSPDAQVSMTASSVALDKNKTKGELTKEIVNLKQIPADALDAKYDVKLSRVSARRADLEVGLYNSTNVMFYHIMTSSEWNSTKDDPAALAALKSSIETGGWAVDNRDEQKAGVEYNTKTVYNYLLNEDTEYVIVSLARNIYMQYTDPVATEPFRTKPIVKDNPEASISQVKVTLTDAGRTAFRSNYEYSEGTALFYHQYIIDHSLITDFLNGDKTRLTNYLMDNTDVLDVNIWPGIDDKEYSNFYWDGMDPAQKYYYAMIGEDWNGVFSEISIDSISTLAVIGGPNPEVKIQSLITDNNDWFVNFAIVQDVVNMRYMILEDTYSTDPDFTFDDCKQFWTDLLIGEGGFTSVNSGSVSVPIKNNVRYIALAVPYGIDADNKEFQGSLYMQGFDLSINPSDPNKCIVLQDDFENVFFNNRTRAVSSTSVNAVSPRVIEIPRLKASDIPTMKTEIEGNSVDKTIFMNIKKLGSSPKISTK